LGNIRLKYSENPSTEEVTILEENHYYPYGLTHKGYNSNHKVFIEDAGGNITLTPVTPLLGDSYKYKFGGKEYQDEFDINSYDFGARNYDPALGRWMNMDPLAEFMRRHSPYNYAFNNPIYFIDPDGMSPIPMAVTSLGQGIDGVQDITGFNVDTVDKNGKVLDSQHYNNSGDAHAAASKIQESIDSNSGASSGSGGGASLTNKRNVGGVAGLSMGADGVGTVGKSEVHPFSATVVIDKSVPSDLFSDIAVITEDKEVGRNRTDPPIKHGSINGVDGFFLKNQSESKSWFKISGYSEATIYYNSATGTFDAKDTTGSLHPVRLDGRYYVDWVDRSDKKRQPPTKNPFRKD
jgi:RHS repeat-associated protein